MNAKRMTAYLSHPYGGRKKEKMEAEKVARAVARMRADLTIVSPLHNFAWMKYHKGRKYWEDLDHCLVLLENCDMMIVSGRWWESVGCCVEIGYARALGIPIYVMGKKQTKALTHAAEYADKI